MKTSEPVKVIKEFKGTFEITKAFYETFKECMSEDETRKNMCYIYFDKDNMSFVATDGRKIIYHVDNNINLTESGHYEPVKIGKTYKLIPVDMGKTTKQGNLEFPRWKRVIPDLENMENIVIDDTRYFSISGKIDEDSKLICQFVRNLDCNINVNFLLKVLKHVDSFTMLKNVEHSSKHTCAVLCPIDANTHYVFMPMLD